MGGWGGGGGVNNVPLDIHLHDDLFLLTASTVPYDTDALHPSFSHFISFHFISFLHSFYSFHSFIHSFIQSFIQSAEQSGVYSRGARAQPSKSKHVYRRANSACTAEAPPSLLR